MILIADALLNKKFNKKIQQKKWYENIYAFVLKTIHERGKLTITVLLIDDKRMRLLNAEYRGMDKTTDVLSFRYPKDLHEKYDEGELYISIPQAQRQSKRYGISLVWEVARLSIHGFLHLYGYDHMKAKERKIMRSLEKKVILLAKKNRIL